MLPAAPDSAPVSLPDTPLAKFEPGQSADPLMQRSRIEATFQDAAPPEATQTNATIGPPQAPPLGEIARATYDRQHARIARAFSNMQGDWVRVGTEYHDLEIRTRRVSPAYEGARAAKRIVAAIRLGTAEANLPPAVEQDIEAACLCEKVLTNVRNLKEKDGREVTFGQFRQLLKDSHHRLLLAACIRASGGVVPQGLLNSTRELESGHSRSPSWLALLPAKFAVIDVETTGINSYDNIVAFAALLVESASLLKSPLQIRCMNLIFDPGKKCHPDAARVHGLDEWTLRHQQFFPEKARAVREFLEEADVVVAHNAEFDISFINRELTASGLAPLSKPAFCTMLTYRQRYAGRASLSAIAQQIGLSRSSGRHGALEDAWLTLHVYLWLHGGPRPMDFSEVTTEAKQITNLQPVPPMPGGVLPPRKRRPRVHIA